MTKPKVASEALKDELTMIKALYRMGATQVTVGSTTVLFSKPYEPPTERQSEIRLVTPDGVEVFPIGPGGDTPVAAARRQLDSILEDTLG